MIVQLRHAGLFLFSLIFFVAAGAALSAAPSTLPASTGRPLATAAAAVPASAPAPVSTESLLFLPTEADPASSPFLAAPDPFSTSLSILTSLALVIALIFALSWFLQKRHGLNGSLCGRTLGVLPIDGRRFIYIIDVLGKVLVLGVTEHHISLLAEITDKPLIDSLRIQPGGAPTIPGIERVLAFLKQKRTVPATADGQDDRTTPDEPSFAEHAEKAQQQIRRMESLIIRRDPPPEE
ncbi:MAG TPA: flagellar biosynthetic protein FliO [Candidatus Ozemobacteraceae bacterium]|nr:flagellar biosynthetic protein FliO [Candidatus Ozemobacteraceae bacterium]